MEMVALRFGSDGGQDLMEFLTGGLLFEAFEISSPATWRQEELEG